MLFWDNGHWTLMDIGSGNSRAAQAARQEILSLSEKDIMALMAQTKAH
jgi:hypothetical protein